MEGKDYFGVETLKKYFNELFVVFRLSDMIIKITLIRYDAYSSLRNECHIRSKHRSYNKTGISSSKLHYCNLRADYKTIHLLIE